MDSLYLLWLLTLSNKQFLARNYRLLSLFESGKELYEACNGGLDFSLFSDADRKELSSRSLDKAEELFEKCEKDGISIVGYYDSGYPEFLRQIHSPPVALFVKGTLPDTCGEPAITIIGTRNYTEDGRKNAARFAYALSSVGYTVVSGMARGIDTFAHKGCLLANESPTVAVLAGGVDHIYPLENRDLYSTITQHGAVISEALPGTAPQRAFFPIRNRILSGLTFGTLVIETASKGGSLITAACALEQNRLVFAVPGALNAASSKGTNKLIKDGAIFCSGISVINEEYFPIYGDKIKKVEEKDFRQHAKEIKNAKKAAVHALGSDERKIAEFIGNNSLSADEISAGTGFTIQQTLVLLQQMELSDVIKPTKGGLYTVKL